MRRTLVEKKEVSRVNLSLPEAEQVEEEETERKSSEARVPVKKAAASSGKALRWTILISGSLGVFALLIPILTGASLTEWLQSADFKKAYSSSNMTFMRGMAALKAGNLTAATDAVMELPVKSSEAEELAAGLFPQLLKAKDYGRAARISERLIGTTHVEANPLLLGNSLGGELGLKGALEFLTQNPDGLRNRKLILPGVFAAVVPKELSALENLVPTLTGEEQASAVQVIVQNYITARRFEDAWKWSEKLPEATRELVRTSLVTQEISLDPQKAVQHLGALKPSTSLDAMRHNLTIQLGYSNLELARRVAETISDKGLKESGLRMLESQARELEERKAKLAGLDKLPTVEEKMDTLLDLMMNGIRNSATMPDLLPRLTALAQKNPSLVARHDEIIRYMVVSTQERVLRQKYLALMLDPEARTALIAELKSNQTVTAELQWSHGSGKASGVGNMDLSSGSASP